MAHIPENLLDEILSRSDIVELILSYIPLKRAGRNFKAPCPFHQEKTPSFIVSPERQIYHCFGCQAGGNAINFLMRYERLEFLEAVEVLAKKAGVVLPKVENYNKQDSNIVYYKINEMVCNFYQNLLNSSQGTQVKDYLIKRGIKEQTQKLFKVGFAADRWDALIGELRQKGISLSLMDKAGLIVRKEDGGYYDRFRNRLMFPIFDIKSRILGFGGRILQADKEGAGDIAKYINSPENPIYIKGRNLYGFNFAKEAVVEADSIIIVEGYLDCIMPYQEGIHNIVASLGTAFTPEQARAIKRYTPNVVMVYDADDAGQLAALRSLDIFLEEDMQVRVVALPPGFDPDLYVRKHGINSFNKLISSSEGLFDYKLDILKSRSHTKEIEGKLKIAEEMLASINRFKNPILRSAYIKKLSEELDLKEESLILASKKIKTYTYATYSDRVQRKSLNINPTEKLLIKLMLEEQELIQHMMDSISPADFKDERVSKIVSIMFDLFSQGKKILASNLVNYLPEQNLSQIICEATLLPDIPDENKNHVISDCIRRLKEQGIKMKREHLRREIKLAQDLNDERRLRNLMEEFCRITKSGSKIDEVEVK
jgi:DNA primase